MLKTDLEVEDIQKIKIDEFKSISYEPLKDFFLYLHLKKSNRKSESIQFIMTLQSETKITKEKINSQKKSC